MSSVNYISSDCGSWKSLLSPEIFLKIAECLVEIDPLAILSLLLTSKKMHSLLTTYEKSIIKSVFNRDHSLSYLKSTKRSLFLSLGLAPDLHTVGRFKYAWLLEMKSRNTTIEFLLFHELTEMMDDTGNWPTLDIPKDDLARRLQIFKRRALLLMYELADCTVGFERIADVRHLQSEFLESLSVEDLAALACMGEVLGHGYSTMTKNVLARHEYKDSLLCLQHCEPHRGIFIPLDVRTGDIESDHWIRECMCVFEDKVQRYGPYFAWAFLDGCSMENRRPDVWFREEMQNGLRDMKAFELGHIMSFASLQSVVWRVFCSRAECVPADRWNRVKNLVEVEIAEYKKEGAVAQCFAKDYEHTLLDGE